MLSDFHVIKNINHPLKDSLQMLIENSHLRGCISLVVCFGTSTPTKLIFLNSNEIWWLFVIDSQCTIYVCMTVFKSTKVNMILSITYQVSIVVNFLGQFE